MQDKTQTGNKKRNKKKTEKKQIDKKIIKVHYLDNYMQITIDNKLAEGKKISDLISHVLNYYKHLNSKKKDPNDYLFACSCGYPFLNQQSLTDLSHYHAPAQNSKGIKDPIGADTFLLKERFHPPQNNRTDIPRLFKLATGKNTSLNMDFLYPAPKEEFEVSENLRKKLELLAKYRENCISIQRSRYEVKYKSVLLIQLKNMGFPEERCRAALRYCYNNVENAVMRLTDESFVFSNYDMLKLPNEEVLELSEFHKAVRNAVLAEFNKLSGEQLEKRVNCVMKIVFGNKCRLLDNSYVDDEDED